MHPVEALIWPLGRTLRSVRPDAARSLAEAPEFRAARTIELTSPAYRDGEVIPARFCGPLIGKDLSPALAWSALPEGTVDLLLVFEDLDAPRSAPALHTIVAFAPRPSGIPEGALRTDDPTLRFLPTLFGRAKYAGPRPLPGHGTHRYRFHLYALDTPVDMAAVGSPDRLPAAVAGHVLASGTLAGTRTC
ncbi:YbhB/YbcL family Raf kinase inhibitor-like protein [Leifsonia sp. ZF2019]|uniref:YbhB/YbcL family Raf kinase inhibitor-like protein n=1 Tax=Leifsonia sp. ZF2019 TaxID=2781978 RepID=UPI001CBC4038|nr:YbhB/YbcL family Raf kinase inhibitor-like protein [Leifsonia sp. ZF2019]UAJ77802.1 YbhB/YbcL family Raf kinase inhibitor-like protein [Leifsonia sp. ZF2019]